MGAREFCESGRDGRRALSFMDIFSSAFSVIFMPVSLLAVFLLSLLASFRLLLHILSAL
jgi:hypothetical protein